MKIKVPVVRREPARSEPKPTVHVMVYCPPDLEQKLRQAAHKAERSRNGEIVWRLRQSFEQENARKDGL